MNESASTLSVASLIGPHGIDVDFTAKDKPEAISKLVDLIAADGAIADKDLYRAAVLKREDISTTGLGDGIAIPHGKSEGVARPALAFARTDQGVDWGSPDGTDAHLLFLIAVPQAQAGDMHLRILATLARKLVYADFRQKLLNAANDDQIHKILADVTVAL